MIRTVQILLGLFFLTSGLAKGVTLDYTVLKIDEYLGILGLDWFVRFDMFILILINATEVTLGLMFLLNLRPKLTLWLASLMMLVFTPKTLYVAIKGLMDNSGCFGNLFPMTPWQSNWKNLFMDLLLIFLWLKYPKLSPTTKISLKSSDWLIGIFFISMVLLQVIELMI